MDELDLGATIRGFISGQKVFARFTLQKILGRGGMGVVWLARDEKMGRNIALKFLPEILLNDCTAVAELKRETLRALELTHTNIVRIHDFLEDAQTAAVWMEYVPGNTLGNLRLDQPGQVFAAEALAPYLRQLCAALDYAHHDAKIVHRDLKPANLMIDDRGRLKVMDFGIAASLSESVSRISNRASNSGTLAYMSPAQVNSTDPSAADDLYALGATLYELLTGQPPFKAPEPSVLIHQILNSAPVPINERRAKAGQPPVPCAWEETVLALLAKEPAERPQSGAEVLARLTTGAAAPSPRKENAQRPTSNAEHSSKSVLSAEAKIPKRKPKIILAAAALTLAALGYYYGIALPEQKRQTEIARVEAERQQAMSAAEREHLRSEKEKAAAEQQAELTRLRQEKATAEAEAKAKTEALAKAEAAATQQRQAAPAVARAASRASGPEEGQAWSVPMLGLKMVWIAPGSFTMGSPSSEVGRYDIERAHQVTLSHGYWLGQYEVTQGEWQEIMHTSLTNQRDLAVANQPLLGESDRHPMYYVSWEEAKDFCRRLTKRERQAGRLPDNLSYTLPTEAQWEYACRAGTRTATYSGDLTQILRDSALYRIAWYCGTSTTPNSPQTWTGSWDFEYNGETHKIEIDRGAAQPVGGKDANAWGLHDTLGNVWEWCGDWYGDYPSGSATDPQGANSGSFRVCRGGGWLDSAALCRSARRSRISPGGRIVSLGFRLALSSVP